MEVVTNSFVFFFFFNKCLFYQFIDWINKHMNTNQPPFFLLKQHHEVLVK